MHGQNHIKYFNTLTSHPNQQIIPYCRKNRISSHTTLPVIQTAKDVRKGELCTVHTIHTAVKNIKYYILVTCFMFPVNVILLTRIESEKCKRKHRR